MVVVVVAVVVAVGAGLGFLESWLEEMGGEFRERFLED